MDNSTVLPINRMASVFGEYEWPIYIVTAVYSLLTVLGISLNSLVLIATVQTKSLHNSCNILIAFCAFCDILHQAGHIPRFYYIYSGVVYTNSWHCQIIQTIPVFGLSAGSFVVLSIGIDRFLSAVFPRYYMHKNNAIYLTLQFVPIALFCLFQYYLMFAYTVDQPIICIPPEAFYGGAKPLWSISSCIVYLTAVVIYSIVWIVLKKQQNTAAMSQIFRSLFIITVVVVVGWMFTMGGVMIASLVYQLRGMQMFFLHEAVGLFVNTSLVLNYLVYYKTSTEYRSAFRKQLKNAAKVFGIVGFSTTREERTLSTVVSMGSR